MFVGMQFCPTCGAKGARELLKESKPLTCPGCRAEMLFVRVGTTELHECPECASAWLASEVFKELCLNREEHGAFAVLAGVAATPPSLDTAGHVQRYVPCPVCSKLMNRSNFGRRSGILVDLCKKHGTWFERGELAGILAFIDDGGLERARVEEEERNAEAQKKLAKAQLEARLLSASAPRGDLSIHPQREGWGTMLLREALERLLS